MMPTVEVSVVPNSSFPSMDTDLTSSDMDLSMYDGETPSSVGHMKPGPGQIESPAAADTRPGGYTVEDGRTYLNLEAAHSRAGAGQAGTLPAIDTFSRSLPFQYEHTQPEIMNSWTTKHIDNWTSDMVFDWVYHVAGIHSIDGIIRGEAFQKVTGRDLQTMTVDDFSVLSQDYGHLFYEHYCALRSRASFKEPELAPHSPMLTDTPRHYVLRQALTAAIHPTKRLDDCDRLDLSTMSPYDSTDPTTIAEINGDRYIYDPTDNFTDLEKTRLGDALDEGYSSEGSDRPNVISHTDKFRPKLEYNYPAPILYESPELSPDHGNSGTATQPNLTKGTAGGRKPLGRVEKGGVRSPNKPNRGRKPGQTTRGTHLWEFVRDMLKDKQYNPKLIKWEDRDNGVFRFVESGSVAKLWGRQKGNASMTYEKLSRAMRFCRTADYFADIPKGGKYPKKLCFRFGSRAYGWQTDNQ